MSPLLDHRPVVKDGDLVAELAGGQPVGNVDRRPVPGDLVKFGVNFRLSQGVQGRRGLV